MRSEDLNCSIVERTKWRDYWEGYSINQLKRWLLRSNMVSLIRI